MTEKTRQNPDERSIFPPDEGTQTTAKEEKEAPDQPNAERYLAEHVQLVAETEGSSVAALQAALSEGARKSRNLVGLSQDPTSRGGVILVWDTSGFISG